MADLEKVIDNLKILRTWCAVNPRHGMGLDADDCEKAVGWLDDALELLNLMKSQKGFKCEGCEYSYVEGFGKNERLLCEKHPEIKIADDFYCADYWDAQGW